MDNHVDLSYAIKQQRTRFDSNVNRYEMLGIGLAAMADKTLFWKPAQMIGQIMSQANKLITKRAAVEITKETAIGVTRAAGIITAAIAMAVDQVGFEYFKSDWMDIDFSEMAGLEDYLMTQEKSLYKRILKSWSSLCIWDSRLKNIAAADTVSVTGLLKALSDNDSLVIDVLRSHSNMETEQFIFWFRRADNAQPYSYEIEKGSVKQWCDLACLCLAACGHLDFLRAVGKATEDGYDYEIKNGKFIDGTLVKMNPSLTLDGTELSADLNFRGDVYDRGGVLGLFCYFTHKIENYLILTLMGHGLAVARDESSNSIEFLDGKLFQCLGKGVANATTLEASLWETIPFTKGGETSPIFVRALDYFGDDEFASYGRPTDTALGAVYSFVEDPYGR